MSVKEALESAAEQLENEDPLLDCMDNVVADKIRKVLIDMEYIKRPYNMPEAKRRSVYVDGDTWAALKKLGQGNASEGIRRAVRNKNQS